MVPSGPEPGARMYRWADQCRAMCRPATVNGDCCACTGELYFSRSLLCGASACELMLLGRIVKLLSITPRLASRHQGLRKLSPHLISKAMIFYTLLPLDDPLCMEGRRVPAWGSALSARGLHTKAVRDKLINERAVRVRDLDPKRWGKLCQTLLRAPSM
jgi:hypothetical protein